MKKSIFLFFMVLALLMTSTVPALALGNDYTFSPVWYNSVLDTTIFTGTYKNTNDTFELNVPYDDILNSFLRVNNNLVLGGIDSPDVFVSFDWGTFEANGSTSSRGLNYLSFSSPFNVTIEPGQTINFTPCIFVKYKEAYRTPQYNLFGSCRLNFSNGSYYYLTSNELNRKYYPEADTVSFNLSSSGNVTGITSLVEGELVMFYCTYTNNTDSPLTLSSVTTTYNTHDTYNSYNVEGFQFGYLTSNTEEVVLPSYVEENLIKISNELLSQSSDLKSILAHLNDIYANLQVLYNLEFKLDSIIDYLFESSQDSLAETYLGQMIIPSWEDYERAEELTQKLEEANEKLEELITITESVKVPTSEDVLSGTTPEDVQLTIDDALSNSDVNNVLSTLFNNSMIVTMLLSTISIGAVGYIFFGKKG